MPKSKLEQEVEAEIDRYVSDWGEELKQHFTKTENSFCKTGEGGGVDPTCSPHGGADPILLKEAVRMWMADSLDFDVHFKDIAAEIPGRGRLRQRAEELIKAVDAAPINDVSLYRGSNEESVGIQSWTSIKQVAQEWAKKSGGRVFEIPIGHAKALSFDGFGFNDVEKHYLVDAKTIRSHQG